MEWVSPCATFVTLRRDTSFTVGLPILRPHRRTSACDGHGRNTAPNLVPATDSSTRFLSGAAVTGRAGLRPHLATLSAEVRRDVAGALLTSVRLRRDKTLEILPR